MGFSNTLEVLASGMKSLSQRLRHVSENIANADTPGYRRKMVSFEAMVKAGEKSGAVQLGPVQLDQSDLPKVHDPSHPLASETGHYDGSNVDLLIELADAREAQRSYEANLKMFEQTRKMSNKLNEIMRQ